MVILLEWVLDTAIYGQELHHGDQFVVPEGVHTVQYTVHDHGTIGMQHLIRVTPGETYRCYELGILKE